jgi:uncharacterized protein (TIGR02001 family)
MKKMMSWGMAVVLAAGVAGAQTEVDETAVVTEKDSSEVSVSAEVAVASAYVWRGQVYNNDAVIQPQVTVAQYGISFNIWGNYDLGSNVNDISSDLSEIDFSLNYTIPFNLEDLSIDVGTILYSYPGSEKDSTSELYVGGSLLTWQQWLIPSVKVFGGVSDLDGIYVLFDVVAPIQITDVFALSAGISAGWGSTAYNDDSWGAEQDAGWNDYNFYCGAEYKILDNLALQASLTYTMVDGGSIEEGANENYENDHKFWGDLNLVYTF